MLSKNLRLRLLLLLSVSLLPACTSNQQASQCYPVASWAAPAFRCETTAPSAPAVSEPEPEPTASEPAVRINSETIDLREKVNFENNSAVLLPASKTLLDDVVQTLEDHPELARIRIEGHTDDKANDRYNQRLSKRRAEAVRDYLVQHGIAAGRLQAQGFGESRPIADNATEEGREQNRRVELHIVERSN